MPAILVRAGQFLIRGGSWAWKAFRGASGVVGSATAGLLSRPAAKWFWKALNAYLIVDLAWDIISPDEDSPEALAQGNELFMNLVIDESIALSLQSELKDVAAVSYGYGNLGFQLSASDNQASNVQGISYLAYSDYVLKAGNPSTYLYDMSEVSKSMQTWEDQMKKAYPKAFEGTGESDESTITAIIDQLDLDDPSTAPIRKNLDFMTHFLAFGDEIIGYGRA